MTFTFPFVDDCAPMKRKTLWFGILACCQPVGIALGFIVGGSVAEAVGWQHVFFIEVGTEVGSEGFACHQPQAVGAALGYCVTGSVAKAVS